MPHPNQRSREVTPISGEGASSDVATRSGREGVKGGKMWYKQCLKGAMTMTGHDDGNDGEAGGSGVRCSSATARSDKRLARLPMDHFMRLLEDAYPNHGYPVRQKLKDCVMMRSFVTSGTLTYGAELDEGSDGSDTTPFPGENVVLTVYGACPH
jgi:hypothetical protein